MGSVCDKFSIGWTVQRLELSKYQTKRAMTPHNFNICVLDWFSRHTHPFLSNSLDFCTAMEGLCNCGEDLALVEMFEEELVVTPRKQQMETSRRIGSDDRIEEGRQEEEERVDSASVLTSGGNFRDQHRDDAGREESTIRDEATTTTSESTNDSKTPDTVWTKHKKATPSFSNHSFVEQILGSSAAKTKRRDEICQSDSFLDGENLALSEILRDEEEEFDNKEKDFTIAAATNPKGGLVKPLATMDGQEYTTIEAIYEERVEPAASPPKRSWFKQWLPRFLRRRQTKTRSVAPAPPLQKEEPIAAAPAEAWPVDTDLVLLLEQACHRSMGRSTVDVMSYMTNLHCDSYDDIDSLQGKTVASLEEYMPRRIARAVVDILLEQELEERTCVVETKSTIVDEESTPHREIWDGEAWGHHFGEMMLLTNE